MGLPEEEEGRLHPFGDQCRPHRPHDRELRPLSRRPRRELPGSHPPRTDGKPQPLPVRDAGPAINQFAWVFPFLRERSRQAIETRPVAHEQSPRRLVGKTHSEEKTEIVKAVSLLSVLFCHTPTADKLFS